MSHIARPGHDAADRGLSNGDVPEGAESREGLPELISMGRLCTPAQLLAPAWLEITGGLISALGVGEPPRAPDRDLGPEALVIPGMVDMHTHGGGGHDMTSRDAADIRAALAWSLGRGVTASVLSTVSAPLDDLATAIGVAGDLMGEQARTGPRETRLLGVHLEGPFLSPRRRGAHDERALRPPRPADVDRLLGIRPGTVLMVTLAPELQDGLAGVRAVLDAGAVPAIGHTDADARRTGEAISAGARVATHLFNGMPGLHHRAPGPVGALLAAQSVVCELINDGWHLDPAVVAIAARAAGRGRIALITDSVAATGGPPGPYRLGGLTVERTDGAIRVVDGSSTDRNTGSAGLAARAGAAAGPAATPGLASLAGGSAERALASLAGGSAGLDEALRRAVDVVGIPLGDAVAAVTSTPAAALGVGARVGSIAVGRSADLCVLDADLAISFVCLGGRWLVAEPGGIPDPPSAPPE